MAVFFGEAFEGAVGRPLEVVEVPYYGEGGWSRWEVLEPPCSEDKVEDEEDCKVKERVAQHGKDLHGWSEGDVAAGVFCCL